MLIICIKAKIVSILSNIFACKYCIEDKKEEIQSYDKSPYTNINVKRAKWQHKQRHKKVRLHSDCGPT